MSAKDNPDTLSKPSIPTDSQPQPLVKAPDSQLLSNSPVLQCSGRTIVRLIHDDENPKLTLTSYTHPKPPVAPETPDADPVGDEHANLTMPHEPSTYQQAMASPEAPQWLEVSMYEMEALKKTGTFEWIERPPPEHQVVGSCWVFKVKQTSSGEIEKFHAQVVVKGYTEVPGIDFFKTYAPTI
jgi:hypothetical protein